MAFDLIPLRDAALRSMLHSKRETWALVGLRAGATERWQGPRLTKRSVQY